MQGHLAALAMARARIEVQVGGPGPADDVAFLLAANPGRAAPAPGQGGVGGRAGPYDAGPAPGPHAPARPALVFDEVDAGIGGEAALAVGRALADAGRGDHQVLVVTHLPQVAAFADAHVA